MYIYVNFVFWQRTFYNFCISVNKLTWQFFQVIRMQYISKTTEYNLILSNYIVNGEYFEWLFLKAWQLFSKSSLYLKLNNLSIILSAWFKTQSFTQNASSAESAKAANLAVSPFIRLLLPTQFDMFRCVTSSCGPSNSYSSDLYTIFTKICRAIPSVNISPP